VTPWTWVALALIVGGWAVAFVLDRRGSQRSHDAKVASAIVTRLVVAALLAWAAIRVVGNHDALHLFAALVVSLVALASLVIAVLGFRGFVGRSEA
jgi:hypothetical protein